MSAVSFFRKAFAHVRSIGQDLYKTKVQYCLRNIVPSDWVLHALIFQIQDYARPVLGLFDVFTVAPLMISLTALLRIFQGSIIRLYFNSATKPWNPPPQNENPHLLLELYVLSGVASQNCLWARSHRPVLRHWSATVQGTQFTRFTRTYATGALLYKVLSLLSLLVHTPLERYCRRAISMHYYSRGSHRQLNLIH